MKRTIKTLALITTGLVVGVVVGRVWRKMTEVNSDIDGESTKIDNRLIESARLKKGERIINGTIDAKRIGIKSSR